MQKIWEILSKIFPNELWRHPIGHQQGLTNSWQLLKQSLGRFLWQKVCLVTSFRCKAGGGVASEAFYHLHSQNFKWHLKIDPFILHFSFWRCKHLENQIIKYYHILDSILILIKLLPSYKPKALASSGICLAPQFASTPKCTMQLYSRNPPCNQRQKRRVPQYDHCTGRLKTSQLGQAKHQSLP